MPQMLADLMTRLSVAESGEVATWGRGQAGSLGQGDETSTVVPRVVTSLQGIRIRNAAAGWNHSAFVTGLIASPSLLHPH